jgi:hypothetical protein
LSLNVARNKKCGDTNERGTLKVVHEHIRILRIWFIPLLPIPPLVRFGRIVQRIEGKGSVTFAVPSASWRSAGDNHGVVNVSLGPKKITPHEQPRTAVESTDVVYAARLRLLSPNTLEIRQNCRLNHVLDPCSLV